jgi:predicted small secreted protein
MKKIISVFLIVVFCFFLVGCYTMVHQVGKGAQGDMKVSKTQWYILWGLVPLNDANSQAMAGGATDYTIMTQMSPLDFVMNIFTGMVTVYSRTVTVTK